MEIGVLTVSLLILTLGAEALVRGASAIALRAGLSPLFVGLTIVGFGTSTPELGASVVASLERSSGVAVGNVIGSNIFNIGVILGVTALISPIRVQLSAVRRDLLVGLAAGCVPFVTLLFGGVHRPWLGYVLLVLLSLYLAVAYRAGRRAIPDDEALAADEVTSTLGIGAQPERLLDKLGVSVTFVVLGLVCLVFGSRWFVQAALQLARNLGVSDLVIGLTVVSVGTSLPELVTSVVAARRRNPDIALGNILGSNIFNLLGILGVSAAIQPLTVSREVVQIDVPVMLVGMVALLPIMRTGGMVSRREGALLLAGYAAYVAAIFIRAD